MNENIDLTKILKDCPEGWKFYSSVLGEVEFIEICINPFPPHMARENEEWFLTHIDEREYPIQLKAGLYRYNVSSAGEHKKGFGECTLFPSREQRDWNKFTAPWYKKLVEPKFKVGDKIVNGFMKYMGAPVTQGTILKITDDKYIFTDGSCMSISSQDSWELASDKKPKFDPKTLKAFDKVLIWHCASGCWKCEVFSHLTGKYTCNCIYGCYTRCMPYNDETKRLVGTTDEAPEYYRYWED